MCILSPPIPRPLKRPAAQKHGCNTCIHDDSGRETCSTAPRPGRGGNCAQCLQEKGLTDPWLTLAFAVTQTKAHRIQAGVRFAQRDKMQNMPDWSDFRYPLEDADGTLYRRSVAARCDHTTVARRLARLEAQLASTCSIGAATATPH